jgi:hypothetical protein
MQERVNAFVPGHGTQQALAEPEAELQLRRWLAAGVSMAVVREAFTVEPGTEDLMAIAKSLEDTLSRWGHPLHETTAFWDGKGLLLFTGEVHTREGLLPGRLLFLGRPLLKSFAMIQDRRGHRAKPA